MTAAVSKFVAGFFSRRTECEDSRAYVGTYYAVTITRPFTRAEIHVFDWLVRQDSMELINIEHLDDGRDVMVFQRLYTSQTREQAIAERREHLEAFSVKR